MASTRPAPGIAGAPFNEILGADFETASRAVMGFLRQRLGFGLWMVTRTNEEDWIVLTADDFGYDVRDGDVFRWSDSFCSRMVQGLGPNIAPSSADVPAYLEARIGSQVSIAAYIGVPIHTSDGELFGTLCAIDPRPQPPEIVAEQPLIELLAGLLGNILSNERAKEGEQRRAERAELESLVDPLTGLANRRGWERVLEAEEARARRYGDAGAIVMMDLDNLKTTNDNLGHAAGDELIRSAAAALRPVTRAEEFAARLGGDEFGLLALRCSHKAVDLLGQRIETALAESGVSASIGVAVRDPVGGFKAACQRADVAMYEAKRLRRLSSRT